MPTGKQRTRTKTHITIDMKEEVVDRLKTGAAAHGIPYQTYMQWLVEEGLRSEARYYDWPKMAAKSVRNGPRPTEYQEVERLIKLTRRRLRTKKNDKKQTEEQ